MKKNFLLLTAMLVAVFCVSVSCSNSMSVSLLDDETDMVEARLSKLKQQYMKYAVEYGIPPQQILFYEDLKKHIDMIDKTEADVRNEVAKLATLYQQCSKTAAEYGMDPKCFYFGIHKMKYFMDMTEADMEKQTAETASHFGYEKLKVEEYIKKNEQEMKTNAQVEPTDVARQ